MSILGTWWCIEISISNSNVWACTQHKHVCVCLRSLKFELIVVQQTIDIYSREEQRCSLATENDTIQWWSCGDNCCRCRWNRLRIGFVGWFRTHVKCQCIRSTRTTIDTAWLSRLEEWATGGVASSDINSRLCCAAIERGFSAYHINNDEYSHCSTASTYHCCATNQNWSEWECKWVFECLLESIVCDR